MGEQATLSCSFLSAIIYLQKLSSSGVMLVTSDAALVVHSDHVPDVGASTVPAAAGLPGIGAKLPVMRHTIEGPDQFAGADIPGALVARDAARLFGPRTAGYHQILVDARRRGQG